MLRTTLPSTVEISKKEFIRFLGGPVVEPVTAWLGTAEPRPEGARRLRRAARVEPGRCGPRQIITTDPVSCKSFFQKGVIRSLDGTVHGRSGRIPTPAGAYELPGIACA